MNPDENRESLLALFTDAYGRRDAALWLQRWPIFFTACAEAFDFRDGAEWKLAHYRFEKAHEKVLSPAV